MPSSQALLAEVCCSAGRLDQALENVSRALNSEELREGYYYAADIYRVQGELLLANGSDESAAEACFANALRIAQQQGARSLELRSAVSLGELRKRQGKATESHTLVLSALDGFDVSFDTVDVRRAMALLSVH